MLVGVAFLPPSFPPVLQNIGILHHKKAKLRKHMRQSVTMNAYVYKAYEVGWTIPIHLNFVVKWRNPLYCSFHTIAECPGMH